MRASELEGARLQIGQRGFVSAISESSRNVNDRRNEIVLKKAGDGVRTRDVKLGKLAFYH